MTAFRLVACTLSLPVLAIVTVSTASAATIGHPAPRAPLSTETSSALVSPASALPYACNKTEASTRLERRSCS